MNENQEPQPGCSKNNEETARGGTTSTWTRKEKYALLQALKLFGSNDIMSIKDYLPNKTPEQIRKALADYKAQAAKHYNVDRRRKKNKPEPAYKPTLPLSNWAQLLVDKIGYEDLHTETAAALRLIAEMEDIPQTIFTENIDFRAAYHLLANAMDGKALQVDKYLAALLNKAIVETALTSKAFNPTTLQQILDKLIVSKETKHCQSIPVSNTVDAIAIHHLASQNNYNPLNLSLEHLKSVN